MDRDDGDGIHAVDVSLPKSAHLNTRGQRFSIQQIILDFHN